MSALERMEPAPPSDAVVIDAPVRKVTLLEDRAQIIRAGRVTLQAGQNRVLCQSIATVVQDVSVRGESTTSGVTVVDVKARRAVRVRLQDKPENARVLEQRIEALASRHAELVDEQRRDVRRLERVEEILARGAAEIPVDAGWGIVNNAQWADTFDTLFKRARALRERILQTRFAAEDAVREINALTQQRHALDRADHSVVAWIEADVMCERAGEVELRFEYVSPNALWRPIHSAQLRAQKLSFQSSAAVWQQTGEDWKDAELVFSTARSSLGTEPPLLSDDLLSVKKKSDTVVVQARQVAVQRAGLGSAGAKGEAPKTAVQLPGVDDGGEIRNLKAPQPCTVPSDGKPCIIPLFSFEDDAETALIAFPELEPKAFLRSTQANRAPQPILAGPVELLLQNGFVGWTQTLFVAPGEKFQLSFGPDDAVRVLRRDKAASETDAVDKWTRTTTQISVYLSNLSDVARKLEVTERIPVSEIEHVRVELVADQTTFNPRVDEHGMVRWDIDLAPQGHVRLQLTVRVATAPGVRSLS